MFSASCIAAINNLTLSYNLRSQEVRTLRQRNETAAEHVQQLLSALATKLDGSCEVRQLCEVSLVTILRTLTLGHFPGFS